MEHNFLRVSSADGADLVVRRIGSATFLFKRLDPLMSTWAQLIDVKSKLGLSEVLQEVSHFNFHLYHHTSASPLQQDVEVVLHQLTHIVDSEKDMYIPDGEFDMPLFSNRANTIFVHSQPTASVDCKRVFYGLSVKNYSGYNLFPYLIYFDPSDYSMQVMSLYLHVTCYAYIALQFWYHPSAAASSAPLAARYGDGRPSELSVGYGEANVDALEFSLPEGATSDVGFLRLFVTTTYVDMTVVEQSSPFFAARGAKKMRPPPLNIWDAWTYVLRTEETRSK